MKDMREGPTGVMTAEAAVVVVATAGAVADLVVPAEAVAAVAEARVTKCEPFDKLRVIWWK